MPIAMTDAAVIPALSKSWRRVISVPLVYFIVNSLLQAGGMWRIQDLRLEAFGLLLSMGGVGMPPGERRARRGGAPRPQWRLCPRRPGLRRQREWSHRDPPRRRWASG